MSKIASNTCIYAIYVWQNERIIARAQKTFRGAAALQVSEAAKKAAREPELLITALRLSFRVV